MGGEIGLESEEGKGSTFWFTAIFGKQVPGAETVKLPEVEAIESFRGWRVLSVDDNEINRQIVAGFLDSWGFRHDEAGGAKDALRMLHDARAGGDRYRLAILDMLMPEMDGEELGKKIKADPVLKDTPLIMMTSIGRRGDANRFEEIGFEGYLTKPVKSSVLFDCVVTVLAGGSAGETTKPKGLVTRHTISEARRRKIRILLAEDNITNQQVAKGIIEKLGYRVDVVANGKEAVKALEDRPYDVVLMDCQMPEMDGYEATRAIRNWKLEPEEKSDSTSSFQSRVSSMPIIAMTAHAMKGDRERCIHAGMDDYISKPVTPRVLAEVLERWLMKRERDECSGLGDGDGDETGDLKLETRDAKEGPDAPIFDHSSMMERLMNDDDLARTIISAFLDDIPKQIEALKGYLDQEDVESAERQAHTIKGASANVSGMALRDVAFEMEKAGKAGDLHGIAALMPELERQFNLLNEAMLREGKID